MARFAQLHLLTSYGPSNLNRDDLGRPKTVRIGDSDRLRVSSQAIKRAVRISDVFRDRLQGRVGERTQRLGQEVEDTLKAEGVSEDNAREAARLVADVFGKIRKDTDAHPTYIEQLAFIGPEERRHAFELARRIAEGEKVDLAKEGLLRHTDSAADIAMFGRMLADDPDFNREAAVQVAHAFTTHEALVQEDYYTAVDDLKQPGEDAGAGFIGTLGFGSGVFYLYVCIDRALLIDNLGGNRELALDALDAFVRALATVSPSGKQASFASRSRADYMLAERGDQQPRSLAGAFVAPVCGTDLVKESAAALSRYRQRMDSAYGACADATEVMSVPEGKGTLDNIVALVTSKIS